MIMRKERRDWEIFWNPPEPWDLDSLREKEREKDTETNRLTGIGRYNRKIEREKGRERP